MPDPTSRQILVEDPLSKVTRSQRRILLGVSTVGIVIAKTGLIPTKISALGIEFSPSDQSMMLTVLAFVVVYFVVSFVIYGASDLIYWYFKLHEQRRKEKAERDVERPTTPMIVGRLFAVYFHAIRPVSFIRATFEFALPIAVGIYTTIILWQARP